MSAVLFGLPVTILLVAIVVMIVRAVRVTNATIAKSGLDGSGSSHGAARRVIDRIRSRDFRCPRCGGQAFSVLGQDGRWMCASDPCRFEFPGPAHVPADAA